MAERRAFLLLGHRNPDEDCLSSLVACALLLAKFDKDRYIYLGTALHEHFQYLGSICRFNGITILGPQDSLPATFDTLILCDIPKPSMLDCSAALAPLLDDPSVLKMEIDHHIGADSDYGGDPGYRLVSEASSTSELVGDLAMGLRRRGDLLRRYGIRDPLSRNLVLAVLTGIIGDSKMGQFLKGRREKRFYRRFSRLFNAMLARSTHSNANFSNMRQVFGEIQRLSGEEAAFYEMFVSAKRRSAKVGYSYLHEDELAALVRDKDDLDTLVSAARAAADALAEESGVVSLVVYADPAPLSDLVQFRIRRSRRYKRYDLRQVLPLLGARDGGGHEGAIGFRFKKEEIDDLGARVEEIVRTLEEGLP